MSEHKCTFCGSRSYGKGNCPWSPFKNKAHLHAGDNTKCSWCGSSVLFGPGCPNSPTGLHQAGASIYNQMAQEGFIQAYVMTKLSERICDSKAFQMGLIDGNGHLVRKAETLDEQAALSPVDMYILKLKSLLGNKLDLLNHEVYLEKVVENSKASTIEQYSKEVQLKSDMEFVVKRFKEVVESAQNNSIPIVVLEKIILDTFTNF